MAAMNAIPGNLPVFDGKGYEDWCVKMDAILGFQELDEIVRDGFQEPPKNASAECWISLAVTFWSTFSLYKYVQRESGLPESAPDRHVFKIKMDESEQVLDRVKFRNKTLLKETLIMDDLEHN